MKSVYESMRQRVEATRGASALDITIGLVPTSDSSGLMSDDSSASESFSTCSDSSLSTSSSPTRTSGLAARRKKTCLTIDVGTSSSASDSGIPACPRPTAVEIHQDHALSLENELQLLERVDGRRSCTFRVRGTWMLDGKLVATACPPGKSSIRALWRLVAGSGVRRIVQLCDAEECAAYLPESGELAAEIRAPVQVRQLHVRKKSRGGGWQLTTLELTDAQGKVRHVEHAACSAWRDGDVPPANAVSELLQLVEDVCEEDAPTLVHCRGGLGRTGVFVALCSLIRQARQQLRRGESLSASVSQTVLDIRKQRPGLVQTPQQHRFISDTLAAWIAERGGKRLGASDEFSVSTSATSGMPSSSEISI